MPAPGEHKTVQARILEYAQQIGWIPPGGMPRELFRTLLHQLMTAEIRVNDLDLAGLELAP